MSRTMTRMIGVGICLAYVLTLLSGVFAPRIATAEVAPSLRIEQLKITSDDQFVTLANTSVDVVDLSSYELVYLNADNKPAKTFTFTGSLKAGGYYVMSDALYKACYYVQIDAVTLGLSTTAGSLQLWRYATANNKTLESSVSWIKTRKSDTPVATVTLPTQTTSFLQRKPASNEWQTIQPSALDPCQLEVILPTPVLPAPDFYFLPSLLPPVSYVTAPSDMANVIVNRNPGKMAPIINEILPDPASPLTDADDEFIELYNPNDTTFDLSDFKLAFGSTSPRRYTFPGGTTLGPKEFKAFTSGDTSISLSNTLSQVWLVAPNEQLVGESKPYQDAKEGQSWAFNGSDWVWTASPSPNKANTLSVASAATAKPTALVLGINNETAQTTQSDTATSSIKTTASVSNTQLNDAAPLHPGILAGIGLLAVAYALYEYRHDISDKYFQFRRYLRLRREAR